MASANPIKTSIASITIALLFATSASASTHPRTGNLDSLGSSSGIENESHGLIAEVHEAETDDSESFLSVTWSIENTRSSVAPLAWLRDGSYLYTGTNFAGVTIVDRESGIKYHPIMDGEGACLCSGEDSNEFSIALREGKKVAYWSLYSIPQGIESFDLELPKFDPIEDIPIS